MNKNKKILKTLFALGAITMVAAAPIVLDTINTESPKTADDGTPSIATVAAPVIESVTYKNSTADGAKLVSVKFNFTTSTTIAEYDFATGTVTGSPLRLYITVPTAGQINLDVLTYNDEITETSVTIGDAISQTATYEFLYPTDNINDSNLKNGALNLRMGANTKRRSDAVNESTPLINVGAIPKNDANDVVTEISSITTSANDEDLEITFNLNKEAIPTIGWDIGERDSVPAIPGARLHYKLSTDTDYTEITAFTTTGGSLTLGGDIPTADIVATTSIGTTFVEGSDYDFRVEYLFTADHKATDSIQRQIVDDVNGTIDIGYTIGGSLIANLEVGQGTNGGEIDISWDTNFESTANTVHYIAVRETLNPAAGWRIYSSSQSQVTVVNDTSVIIKDSGFINQGSQYDISVAIDLDTTIVDDLAYYGDAWTGWDGLVTSVPVATIEITSFLTSYATPNTAPGDIIFTFTEATEDSLKYDFTYDNGSLTNPTIIATANGIAPPLVRVTFLNTTNTGTVQLLRLDAETAYTVEFTYDYPQYGPVTISGGTESTLEAIPFIAVSTALDVTDQTFTVDVEGDPTLIDDDTVSASTPGTADLELIFDDVDGTILTLTDVPTSTNLIGTHVFDISGVTGYTSISLNIIVNEVDATTPLGLDNLIIDDGANEDVGIITTYDLNDNSAEDVIANEPTSVTPTTGTSVGDLNISWLIDYPLGITLSDLEFTFEISIDPTDPTSWVDVSSQTNISTDMKSGVISGLTDPSYSEGVWVQITVDYLDISEDLVPLESTLSAIPKQDVTPPTNGGLSTGALIGIIVGSIAGVALIALGGWFFYKKQNPSDPEDEQGVEPKEKSEFMKKIELKKAEFKEKMAARRSEDMNSEDFEEEQPEKPKPTSKPKTPNKKS